MLSQFHDVLEGKGDRDSSLKLPKITNNVAINSFTDIALTNGTGT